MGLGEAIKNPKIINLAKNSIELISGQKAIIINAKKSIASFKLRVGMPIGVKVTLRKIKMWEFLDRLINIALPRVRDFRGILSNFDGNGNCSIGIKEEIIFPEIDYDTIDKIRGLNISLITNTKNDKIAKILLKKLGIPFKK
jgi:large subunit ribosomal protein L5